MDIIFKDEALEDIKYFKKCGNKHIQNKINDLIEDIIKHPETGIGKPEKLKYELTGLWSRRINNEHRIIYQVVENTLYVISLRGHY